jgi:hypothetical protein
VNVVDAFAGTLLWGVPVVLLPAVLRIRGMVLALTAGLVVGAASIVLVFIGLSVARLLTPAAILLAQTGLAGASALGWKLAGMPSLPWRPRWRAATSAIRADPALAVLITAATAALALQFFMAIAIAPNNFDAMTYHLPRAAYWLQNNSALHWQGGTVQQLGDPPNAEMLQAWTMALSGTDRFVQLVQWLSLVGIALAIFSLARLIDFQPRAAAFAAALFVVLPQPLLQAASAQNDLVVTFFLLAALTFGLRGLRDRSSGDLVVASVALGLAIGTKGTALLALPSLGLIFLAAIWRYRPSVSVVRFASLTAIASIAIWGSFNYILNLEDGRGVFGGVDAHVRATAVSDGVVKDVVRVSWMSFVDTQDIAPGWVESIFRPTGNRILHALYGNNKCCPGLGPVNGYVYDETAGFGFVGLLVFWPVLLLALLGPRSPPFHRLIATAALVYLLLVATVPGGFNDWIARLLIPFVAIGAPLLAKAASRSSIRVAIVALALVGLEPSLFANETKRLLPSGGMPSFLGLDRISQMTYNNYEPDLGRALRRLQRILPATAPLGYVGSADTWDYPLFGEHRERRLVRLQQHVVTQSQMRQDHLAGVFFAYVSPPPNLGAVQLAPGYYLALLRPQ